MLFNSFRFLFLFLPVVVLIYWLIPRGYARLIFLIVASCVATAATAPVRPPANPYRASAVSPRSS